MRELSAAKIEYQNAKKNAEIAGPVTAWKKVQAWIKLKIPEKAWRIAGRLHFVMISDKLEDDMKKPMRY